MTLSPEHLKVLVEESGISPEVIEARGYRTLGPVEMAELKESHRIPDGTIKAQGSALAIPVLRPDRVKHTDILRLNTTIDAGKKGGGKRKYLWPSETRNAVDVSPLVQDRGWLNDPEIPIIVVEGIKKADAILSAGLREGIDCVVLALNGATGWKASAGPNAGTIACPDFLDIPMQKRQVVLVPDSDYGSNLDVKKGWEGLALYLSSKPAAKKDADDPGSKVLMSVVPNDGLNKQGADDYLAAGNTLKELLTGAKHPESVDLSAVKDFRVYSAREAMEAAAANPEPWLIEDLIPEDCITLVIGYSEACKTWHMLSWAMDLVVGQNPTGHPDQRVVTPSKVLFLSQEMNLQRIGRRINRILAGTHYTEEQGDLINDNLMVVDDSCVDFSNPSFVSRMIEKLEIYQPKLVILDSFSMIWSGDENSNTEVAALYKNLRAITAETGVAWILIHHLSKPQQGKGGAAGSKHASRGAGQIVNQADMAYTLTVKDENARGTIDVSIMYSKGRDGKKAPWISRVSDVEGDDGSKGIDVTFVGFMSEKEAANAKLSVEDIALAICEGIPALDNEIAFEPLCQLILGHWEPKEDAPAEHTVRRILNRWEAENKMTSSRQGKTKLYRWTPTPDDD